jgi:uncharacterized protein YdeI (YjbR/CyaY-like superfamily)
MMSKSGAPILFPNRASWRQWLEGNYRSRAEAWLIIRKKGSKARCISLDDAVMEALCFGWIDGKLMARDEDSYLLRFSPRRPDSVWSIHNIRRVEQLLAEGRMTDGGLEKVRHGEASGQWDAAVRREQVDLIPPDLEVALRRKRGCLDAYRKLTASRKQQAIHWLETAKRAETRELRIRLIVEECTE